MMIHQSQFIEMFGAPDFMKRLGDYVSVRTGKLDANASVEGGQYPFFTCAEKTLLIDTYAFDCNAVLLAGNGEFCVKHYNGKFNAYQRTYIIESKDESVLSTKYLYAWLKEYANILKANAIGGVIKYIKLGDITNAQINLPHQDKQLEYVKIYEQADKSKFGNGFKSQFIEMFGSVDENKRNLPIKKIGDFAECFAGATPSTSHPEYWDNGTIRWMSSGEVHKGHIDDTDTRITELGYKNASTKMVPVHSIVIALAGQGKTRGTVAVTEVDLCTNQSLCAIVPNGQVNYTYLYHNFKGRYMELRGLSGDVNGRGGLNLKIIQKIPVIIPPMEDQMKFVAIAEQADKSKSVCRQTIKRLAS